MAALSLFRTISPDAGIISPGIMSILLLTDSLANWIVNANEFGAIRERCFHLHLVDHFRDAFHDLIAGQDLAAFGHEFGNRLAAACSLHDEICYKRDTFGVVELDASCEPPPSDQRRERDHQLVFFTRCQLHELLRSIGGFSMTTSSELGKGRVRVPC